MQAERFEKKTQCKPVESNIPSHISSFGAASLDVGDLSAHMTITLNRTSVDCHLSMLEFELVDSDKWC